MRKNDNINTISHSKIWDKKTFTQRHSLKHFKDFRPEEDEEFTPKTSFKQHQKKIITEALGVVKERAENIGSNKKESLIQILDQRKEMFLVSMSHDILKEEISRIRQQTEDKEKALVDSEKMLKQDSDNFQKYLDVNKQQRIDAEQKADDIAKQKKQKEMTIKEINLKLTTLRAEKTRTEETLSNYKEHKEFLDKLVPKEWEEEKQQKKKQLVGATRKQMNDQSIENVSTNDKPNKGVAIKIDKGRVASQNLKLERQQTKALDEKLFQELEAEFEDNYPMYFQHPDQLQDLFNSLEEKNLFLIQMKQEDEQNIEEMKHTQKMEKQFLNGKSKVLQQQKDTLKRQIEEIADQIKSLKHESEEYSIKSDTKNEKIFTSLVVDLYSEFKEEISIHDPEAQPPLYVLAQIEILFEKLFKEVKLCPIALVEQKRKKAEKDRKQTQRDAQNIRKKEENDRRNEKNRIKMTQAVVKRKGRVDMLRSAPLNTSGLKEVKDDNNEIDEDLKYFKENFQLL